MNRIDHISLIYKQLSNDITAVELEQLQDWLNESEDNKVIAEDIALIWESTDVNDEIISALAGEVDLDVEFALLNERIQTNGKPETKVVPMWRKYIGLAAGLALLIGAGVVLLQYDFGTESQMAELTTGDTAEEIILSDGSVINLNANSTLKYPVEFTGGTREVELSGEAFFDIAKDASHPFTVHTSFEDVSVLGTSFNIRAYEGESNSEVSVTTGKVKVDNGTVNKILLPNEKVVVNHSNGVMEHQITENLNENAWLTNVMVFEDAQMPEVLEDLEAYFDLEFTVENPDLLSCPFDANFNFAEGDDLSTVLTTISKVFSVTPEKTSEGDYILVGGSCQ
jgi:transmembrane sensor